METQPTQHLVSSVHMHTTTIRHGGHFAWSNQGLLDQRSQICTVVPNLHKFLEHANRKEHSNI